MERRPPNGENSFGSRLFPVWDKEMAETLCLRGGFSYNKTRFVFHMYDHIVFS